MGEAHRRRLTGICLPQPRSLSRADAITWAIEVLATAEDDTVSGVTIFPADGSPPVYLPAEAARAATLMGPQQGHGGRPGRPCRAAVVACAAHSNSNRGLGHIRT
jgi:hypothetical protein